MLNEKEKKTLGIVWLPRALACNENAFQLSYVENPAHILYYSTISTWLYFHSLRFSFSPSLYYQKLEGWVVKQEEKDNNSLFIFTLDTKYFLELLPFFPREI